MDNVVAGSQRAGSVGTGGGGGDIDDLAGCDAGNGDFGPADDGTGLIYDDALNAAGGVSGLRKKRR